MERGEGREGVRTNRWVQMEGPLKKNLKLAEM
jgi:hypothetical protein